MLRFEPDPAALAVWPIRREEPVVRAPRACFGCFLVRVAVGVLVLPPPKISFEAWIADPLIREAFIRAAASASSRAFSAEA